MMYEYMELYDKTSVAHSDMKADGSVKVYFEKPVEGGFHHVTCILPQYKWMDNEGFSQEDIQNLKQFTENNAHIILELSQKGGFANAAGL